MHDDELEVGDAPGRDEVLTAADVADGPIPVHVVFGDADPVFPFESGERWAAEIEGATLDRIEGAGHFLQIDAPDDVLGVVFERLHA